MGGAGGDAPRVSEFGDAALLVTFGERIDAVLNARAHALAAALRDARQTVAGLGWPVPSYASVLVPFDPLRLTAEAATSIVGRLLERAPLTAAPVEPPVEMAVRYGGADGPDLAEVAERTGLTPAAVVELHASVEYTAYLLGFAPGFAYLGELPAELELPRRATPRQRVAAGSVAIAGRQTAVYPQATPGGWHLIGRTEVVLWDLRRDPPALITPGRRVRFVPA